MPLIHAAQQVGADLVVQFDEDVAIALGGDEFPDHLALRRGEGLEQVGDFRRVEGVDLAADAPQRACLQRILQALESRCSLVLHVHAHCPTPMSRRPADSPPGIRILRWEGPAD